MTTNKCQSVEKLAIQTPTADLCFNNSFKGCKKFKYFSKKGKREKKKPYGCLTTEFKKYFISFLKIYMTNCVQSCKQD